MKPKCEPEKPKSIPAKPMPKKQRPTAKFKVYQERMEKGPGE